MDNKQKGMPQNDVPVSQIHHLHRSTLLSLFSLNPSPLVSVSFLPAVIPSLIFLCVPSFKKKTNLVLWKSDQFRARFNCLVWWKEFSFLIEYLFFLTFPSFFLLCLIHVWENCAPVHRCLIIVCVWAVVLFMSLIIYFLRFQRQMALAHGANRC